MRRNLARAPLACGLLAALVFATVALAAGGADRAGAGVAISSASQKQILGADAIEVEVTAGKGRSDAVVAAGRTFDHPAPVRPTEARRPFFHRAGTHTVELPLTRFGRRVIARCEARTIVARAGDARDRADLVRDTSSCKPKPIDLSAADRCDFVGDQDGSLCLLPFPDDYYTVDDPSTETGRRMNLKTAAMPANEAGTNIDAEPYNLNDGFSPGQSITLRVPGIDTAEDVAANKLVPLDHLGRYANRSQRVVAIDTMTGERWPIWAEIDSNSDDPDRTALLVHPSVNFASGHRYVIALRSLEAASGEKLKAPEGFRYYRDDLPSNKRAINAQRDRYDSIFRTLRDAGIKRRNLYLAWDFTVASDENIAGRLLDMRDDAFAQLGDDDLSDRTVEGEAPVFQVQAITDYSEQGNPNMARQVSGRFTVPCYMSPDCEPGSRFDLDSNGMPIQHGTYQANFVCMIPRSAVDAPDASPARASLYGHGLLGEAEEATSDPQQTLGNTHNFVFCATDEIGLSSEDIVNDVAALQDLSNFPEPMDRLQQGLLNELYLGRLMIHPDGFVSDPAFRVGSRPVMSPSRLYYNGNSQGGIMGGALTAVSPDFTRASLGVPAMNYSVLLNRSVDFDTYANAALFPSYTDRLERPLVLSIMQMLWDRGESNGYAHRMTTDPLPDTPPHEVLMNVAFGDHQVTTWAADTMARTIGAEAHEPTTYPGRWPGVNRLWKIPRIDSYPHTGSAIVYWDSGPIRPDPNDAGEVIGTEPPPIANVPNRSGKDPHGSPRRTPAEQLMVSQFLRPDANSKITNTCAPTACFSYEFAGP